MVTDPSWFYSSTSQAAAAIIGLVGALWLSRLLQQLESVRQSKETIVARFVDIRGSAGALRAGVRSYAAFLDRRIPAMESALATNTTHLTVTEEVSWLGSRGGSPWETPVSAATLSKLTRDRKLCEVVPEAVKPLMQMVKITALNKEMERLSEAAQDWPSELTDWVGGNVMMPLEALVRRCQQHSERVVPRSAFVMLIALAWLAIAGVLAPLYFLITAEQSVSQHVLLVAFAIGILVLLGYLGWTLWELYEASRLVIPEHQRLAGGE